MDRRSWLWRKKSSEKSPGETESSGSLSSLSERFSDEQDASRASPNHTQSPEISSKLADGEVHDSVTSLTSKLVEGEVDDNVKSLTEKLSAALSNISAKEDLVKQHARVAEEAVSGWEKAEKEVAALKQQLEAAARKNSVSEDRVLQLDGALKECVRQLRQSREDQDQKIHEALCKKTHEWESTKLQLENQLSGLQTQLQAAKAENAASADHDLQKKLKVAEKENTALKLQLHSNAEELKVRTLERELSTQTAETASKQHLESIKKVAKLEAECRRLQAVARKASSVNEHRPIGGSFYVESLMDSLSDSRERLPAVKIDTHKMRNMELNEREPSCSDLWASALITELDQFKNEKAIGKNFISSSVDIDIMDDFLEMERLVALPETKDGACHHESGAVMDQPNSRNSPFKAELEAVLQRAEELAKKLQSVEGEKARLEMTLAESQDQLDMSWNRLMEAEEKLVELQRQLHSVNEQKQVKEMEIEAANAKTEAVESQLKTVDSEVRTLRAKVASLEVVIEEERALSMEVAAKCRTLEDELSSRKCEAELWSATYSNGELKTKQEELVAARKLADCQKTIASLGRQLKSLASLEDFFLDSNIPELIGGSLVPGGELSHSYFPKMKAESAKIINGSSPPNDINVESLPSSNSSSLENQAPEKIRNGFGKLFSRSKNASTCKENQ